MTRRLPALYDEAPDLVGRPPRLLRYCGRHSSFRGGGGGRSRVAKTSGGRGENDDERVSKSPSDGWGRGLWRMVVVCRAVAAHEDVSTFLTLRRRFPFLRQRGGNSFEVPSAITKRGDGLIPIEHSAVEPSLVGPFHTRGKDASVRVGLQKEAVQAEWRSTQRESTNTA